GAGLASPRAAALSRNAIAVATQAAQARHAARYLMGSGSEGSSHMKPKTSTGTGMMAATTPTSSAVMPMLRPRYTSTPMPHTANPTTMLTSSTARFHWYRGGAAATTGAATTGSKPGAGIEIGR